MLKLLRFVGFVFALVAFANGGAFAQTVADCASDEYLGPGDICQSCSADFLGNSTYNKWVDSCGNGVLKCKAYAYKGRTRADSSYYWCFPCPSINNGQTLGISSSQHIDNFSSYAPSVHFTNVGLVWSETERCTATKTGLSDGSCEYTVKITANTSNCANVFTTETDPDLIITNNLIPDTLATVACNWAVVNKNYTYAPINYGVSYNNTANAVCNTCGETQYSADGSLICSTVPLHADKSADGGSFVCKPGAYKSGNSCYGCPMSSDFSGTNTTYMTSNEGATDVKQCFIDHTDDKTGQITGNDGTGKWELSSDCYYEGSAQFVHLIWANANNVSSACYGAIQGFCSSYLGASGNAIGTCRDMILIDGWNTQDIWAFHDFFTTVVYGHECNNDLQGVFTYTD